jgi:hypothetical protein
MVLLTIMAVVAIATDHCLFARRVARTDVKSFHHILHALISAKTEAERLTAIRQITAEPELRHFKVALVADHIVLFQTRSFTSEAYVVAHHLGDGNAWALGWLRGGSFTRAGTYTPPSNPGGS